MGGNKENKNHPTEFQASHILDERVSCIVDLLELPSVRLSIANHSHQIFDLSISLKNSLTPLFVDLSRRELAIKINFLNYAINIIS